MLDTGIGIAADVVKRLFNHFEQADNSTTRRFGGTGLGLVITRYIAKAMNGDVGVESVLGKGSEFWFTAWFEIVAQQPPNEISRPVKGRVETGKQQKNRPRILLCEDEPINQEIFKEILQELGYDVETAGNGAVGFGKASKANYDLILMDMQMPEVSGIEATKLIRALPSYGQVPIIALTANAFESDRIACMGAGMNDFLSKPLDPEVLGARVREWLSLANS